MFKAQTGIMRENKTGRSNYFFKVFLLILLTTGIRTFLAWYLGLGVDEAHYYQYAMFPALSYYDHPPLVGWLIWLSLKLAGHSYLSVRLPAIICGMLTMGLLFLSGCYLFGEKSGFWSVVVFNLVPIFSAIGGLMIVPETLLGFFWLLFLFLLWKIYQESQKTQNVYRWWYALGLTMGLALLTKYTAILLYLTLLCFLCLAGSMHFWWRRKEPYLAVLLSIVCFSPVIVWNWENWWVSFRFQAAHGLGEKAFFQGKVFLRNLGAQTGSYSPLIFILLLIVFVIVVFNCWRRDDRYKLLFSCVFPVFLLFGWACLSNEVLPHWPAVAYLVLLIPLGEYTSRILTSHRKKNFFVRMYLLLALVLGGVMTVTIPAQAIFKILPLPARVDPTNDLVGWEQLARHIQEIQKSQPEKDYFVFTHKFYLAGQLAFHLPASAELYCLSPSLDQYDFWQKNLCLKERLRGRNGLFFADEHFFTHPANLYKFKFFGEKESLPVIRKGKVVKQFFIVRCHGFETDKTEGIFLDSLQPPRSIRERTRHWNDKGFLMINGLAGQSYRLDTFFIFSGWFGSGYVLVPLVSFLIWFKKRRKFWVYWSIFVATLIVGGISVHFLKEMLHTPRPFVYFGSQQPVSIIGPVLKGGSWPSGHAQTVFTGSLFLSWLRPEYWYLWWLTGIFSGISRVYVGAHFPLDVLGGLFIAFFSFLLVKAIAWKVKP